MDYATESLRLHREWKGKLEAVPKISVGNKESLSLAYTPGVAQPCLEIQKSPSESYNLTGRGNTVAVVTDGTAVLGLGDIGPEAAMPVMEGKCVLFKAFGGIDAVPLCIRSKDPEEIVKTVSLLAGSFGGINLEDISSPRCFEIERKLKEACDIPIFHDDQHGTAVVTLAALFNALELTGRTLNDSLRTVILGAGAAGIAIARLLKAAGLEDIILCDRRGAVCKSRNDLNAEKATAAEATNPFNIRGTLSEVMKGADVFIGVSGPDLVKPEFVRSMAKDPILFPMSNPIPEIMPDPAYAAGAAVVGTGRSDFANQINNVLAFPGIFRGTFDVRAREITQDMMLSAAGAIAGQIKKGELSRDNIIPTPFDTNVHKAVAAAVAKAGTREG
ncbi:MAG: NADP-dependent malic enzyme [Oscillospiraceae bacterium]|nr:NADP-dependent malic enzyme [Oscillospiraceae bacterium]